MTMKKTVSKGKNKGSTVGSDPRRNHPTTSERIAPTASERKRRAEQEKHERTNRRRGTEKDKEVHLQHPIEEEEEEEIEDEQPLIRKMRRKSVVVKDIAVKDKQVEKVQTAQKGEKKVPIDVVEEEDEVEEEEEEGQEQENVVDPDAGYLCPKDFSLLVDYEHHVARDIWDGKERGLLKCRHHFNSYAQEKQGKESDITGPWILEDEPDPVKSIVKASNLHKLIMYPKRYTNNSLISALVERWYPETNTFHFPCGELTITLHDVYRILGIPVEGRGIVRKEKKGIKFEQYIEYLVKGIGIEQSVVDVEYKKQRGFSVELGWLAKQCKKNNKDNEATMEMRARGFMLYLLGCTIFSDKSGNKVHLEYCYLLEDLKNVGGWNWGAAALSFIYRQLGMASRAGVKQIAGFLPLLEAWAYDYFPSLGVPNMSFKIGEPTLNRWASSHHQKEDPNSAIIAHRERFDNFYCREVEWQPLKIHYPIKGITWFSGCLPCMDIVEAYHPERVVRQMGRVQGIPRPPMVPNVKVRKGDGSYYKVEHTHDHCYLENWRSHLLEEAARGNKIPPSTICEYVTVPGYESWLYLYSHVLVQRPSRRLCGRLRNPMGRFRVARDTAIDLVNYAKDNTVSKKRRLAKLCQFAEEFSAGLV